MKRIEYTIHHSTATETNLGTMPLNSSYVTGIERVPETFALETCSAVSAAKHQPAAASLLAL